MRVGVQYVRQSRRMRGVLVRIGLFFFHSTALLALLPLVARGLPGGSAGTFTVLLASMGAGAIVAALMVRRIRGLMPVQPLLLAATAMQSLAMVVVAFAPNVFLAVPAMFAGGVAWITVANTLTVAAQMALPDWVRARGMSMYQMSIMGATAVGAALWGQIATWTSINHSLIVAALTSTVLMAIAQRLTPDGGIEEDLTPARVFKVPQAQEPPREGRIQVQIEYRIDPARMDEFMELMQGSRRSRMSQGALDWQVMRDVYEPGRVVECVTDESWTEHLRRFDRVTAADVRLRDRKLAFHIGDTPPVVSRFLIGR
jgi:MFS family permease